MPRRVEGLSIGVAVLGAVSGERSAHVETERLEGIALILRAIEMTIADVEARDDLDGDRQLATLRYMRERWREKAEEGRS